jgi:MFS family permease
VRRYLRVLRQRQYGLLWSGATISALGDGMSFIALVWLVLEAGGGAAEVGWLGAAYTAPIVIGGLAGGILLDRFEPRRVLIVDNAIRGLVMASIPIAAAAGTLSLPHLFLAAGTYGLLYMVSGAGIPTMLPRLVAADDLTTANALESITWGIGGLVGPLLAGLAIAVLGAPSVLAFDAASYFVFVACLIGMGRLPRQERAVPGPGGLGPAVRFILATPAVLAITLMYMTGNVGEGIFTVFAPIYVTGVLGGDATTYGAVVSAWTGGSLVGALLVGALGWRWPLGRSIAAAGLLSGAVLGLLLVGRSIGAMVVILALSGLFASCLTTWAQTIRMRLIPAELRGRVFAVLRTLMRGTPPLGAVLGGALLAGGDPTAAIVAMALLNVVPGLIALVHPALGWKATGDPRPALARG